MQPGPLDIKLDWVADRALRLSLGEDASLATAERVQATVAALRCATLPALLDITPAYTSVLLCFDLAQLEAPAAEQGVRAALLQERGAPAPHASPRRVEIPVCYCPHCGPDQIEVARRHDLAPEEVVRLHAAADYRVAFLGFSPGFPYLLGLPDRLVTPRLERPRTQVPAGSVAIAGRQAGIYPQATPGGWHLLGRTPLALFDTTRPQPALLRPGDRVCFLPVAHADAAPTAPQPGVR